jgi:hypothetical protein
VSNRPLKYSRNGESRIILEEGRNGPIASTRVVGTEQRGNNGSRPNSGQAQPISPPPPKKSS